MTYLTFFRIRDDRLVFLWIQPNNIRRATLYTYATTDAATNFFYCHDLLLHL